MVITKDKPQRIANFELKELIGSGGMANIYKGVQLSLERPVAIKVLHQHLTANEDFVNRFKQEAKQAAILQHQNIVSIIDYGHQDGEYFIAMEYIDGQNLKEILTRIKRLPLEVALLIAKEVAGGLKYAHSNGLIHRDIKPANIMLAKDGRVMITDFGIAKTHGDMSITVTGQTVGSPAYMSPEQAAGRPIDNRCDLFSLGIVLYEIITGEKPFKGETYQQVVTNIISIVPELPSKLRIDVTPSTESIIQKALTKDVDSRFQDADEIVSGLDDELNSYVIPSAKKIISGFVRNPIRTAEKLRTDRISKHMETALYLVNVGHGRLTDAIKEFENVLRFDKNNKLAKEYLDRLKSGQQDFSYNQQANKIKQSLRWIIPAALLLSGLLIAAFLSGWIDFINVKSDDALPIVQDKTATADLSADNQIKFEIGEAADLPEPPVMGKPDIKQGQTTPPARKSSATKPKPTSTSQTRPKPIAKDIYPNQNLAKYGFLAITTEPPAKFSIDFTPYGQTGGPIVKIPPGRHVIEIEADGYKTERKRIFTEENKTESINIVLKPSR
jgi:serine/threonine protein kinase